MSDTLDLFRRAIDEFDRRVVQIREDQWGNDTPCTEWDVRALVRHLVYEVLWFVPLIKGETVAQVGDRFEGDILGDDPKAAWAAASGAALDAAAEQSAFSRTVDLSRGPTPAVDYAWELIDDLAVHGWDLARGIGADDTMDPELAGLLLDWAKGWVDQWQGGDAFAAPVPVPDDASDQVKLLALLGRES